MTFTVEYLVEFVTQKVKEHPELKEEIMDFYSLCLSEIEDGGAEYHEVGMCINDIEELIEQGI
jgi:hypothetical protein